MSSVCTWNAAGQFIASSPSLFPDEYVLEFQKCLDKAEPVPFSDIKVGWHCLTLIWDSVLRLESGPFLTCQRPTTQQRKSASSVEGAAAIAE
jgi:hypothetical protein